MPTPPLFLKAFEGPLDSRGKRGKAEREEKVLGDSVLDMRPSRGPLECSRSFQKVPVQGDFKPLEGL